MERRPHLNPHRNAELERGRAADGMARLNVMIARANDLARNSAAERRMIAGAQTVQAKRLESAAIPTQVVGVPIHPDGSYNDPEVHTVIGMRPTIAPLPVHGVPFRYDASDPLEGMSYDAYMDRYIRNRAENRGDSITDWEWVRAMEGWMGQSEALRRDGWQPR